MLGFIFDLCSIAVGVVVPIFRTWRVLKSKRAKNLVPLAKYWIVFGCFVAIEGISNVLYLSYLVPCYPALKFMTIFYITCFGYDHIYQRAISPTLQHYEPNMANLMALSMRFVPQIAHCALTTTISAVHSLATSNVDLLALPPIKERILEIEEFDMDMDETGTRNETIASHEDQVEEPMAMDTPQQRQSMDNIQEKLAPSHSVDQFVNRREKRARSEDNSSAEDNQTGRLSKRNSVNLVHCRCAGGCSNKRCSCFKAGVKCNQMCHNKADCYNK